VSSTQLGSTTIVKTLGRRCLQFRFSSPKNGSKSSIAAAERLLCAIVGYDSDLVVCFIVVIVWVVVLSICFIVRFGIGIGDTGIGQLDNSFPAKLYCSTGNTCRWEILSFQD